MIQRKKLIFIIHIFKNEIVRPYDKTLALILGVFWDLRITVTLYGTTQANLSLAFSTKVCSLFPVVTHPTESSGSVRLTVLIPGVL